MTESDDTWPEMSFPDAEGDALREAYAPARVILEYGSGGSTVLAAGMPGKLVFSVESDRDWALRLQQRIDTLDLPSPATVYHADIGPTGSWGRPIDNRHWVQFHNYPIAIWDEPFFRHPDVVLIDGRFRAACMLTVLARITRPVSILFDDYVDRHPYHVVEAVLSPCEIIGRLAIFAAVPGLIRPADMGLLHDSFAQATYADAPASYEANAEDALLRRQQTLKGAPK